MADINSLVIASVIVVLLYLLLSIGKRDSRLPPGPPTLPIIGNIHLIPKAQPFLKFTELSKIYGGLFTLKVGPRTLAFITDRKIAREIFDKKSSISSNRPPMYVANELIGGHDHPLIVPYGMKWRTNRRIYHKHFTEKVVENDYMEIVHAESAQMLRDFVLDSEHYMDHPRRFGNSIMTSIMYGVRASTVDAPHMYRVFDTIEHFEEIIQLGATPPVDVFPFLKYIPECLLGNWVSRAKHVKRIMLATYTAGIDHIKNRRKRLGARNTFIDQLLDDEKLGLGTHRLGFLTGAITEAGSDTTATMILCFMQAMVKWPEFQRRAQKQIDAVVGEDRTPTWADYKDLPYVMAIVKECMRWRPATPAGVPHYLDEDYWIDGKLLPKGTTLILNVWGIHHDEAVFPDPDTFNPERYQDKTLLAAQYANSSDYANRDHYGYGVGRRICPGLHLADRNMFVAMAKLLWAFNFEKFIDPVTGEVAEPDSDIVTGYDSAGLVMAAHPFKLTITPRSEARCETIMREFSQAESDVFAKYDDKMDE
ncbi:hypothetical protein EYB26_005698 [Talaromyces marneffei]|uniref:uncharacterized protein n=1 Tax=Talaromyces marneffei TaxID=37727 RepID=UPI0012A9DCE8|nr:uncharacterized protein EYB26_005698 [Talaromyces marneffei]QGA18020.1 hypothetical protein EYB26_005698 [Talaromyces marneffei]